MADEFEVKEFEGKEVVGTKKEFTIYLLINAAIGLGLYLLLDNRLLDKEIWSLKDNIMEVDLLLLGLQGRQCLRIFADREGSVGNCLHIWLPIKTPFPVPPVEMV